MWPRRAVIPGPGRPGRRRGRARGRSWRRRRRPSARGNRRHYVPPYRGRYRLFMGARQARTSVASRVTYLLEPKNWLIATVILIGGHADGLAGAGWGLLAAFFVAVLPTVFIDYGVRHGNWDDRNVGARRPRMVVLAFI